MTGLMPDALGICWRQLLHPLHNMFLLNRACSDCHFSPDVCNFLEERIENVPSIWNFCGGVGKRAAALQGTELTSLIPVVTDGALYTLIIQYGKCWFTERSKQPGLAHSFLAAFSHYHTGLEQSSAHGFDLLLTKGASHPSCLNSFYPTLWGLAKETHGGLGEGCVAACSFHCLDSRSRSSILINYIEKKSL